MSATRSELAAGLLALLVVAPAQAQPARFDWLSRIDAELPAIEACAHAVGEGPVGVSALRAEGPERRLILRDAASSVWSCTFRDGRAAAMPEPDPAGVRHRRPVFWLARFGEPWAECWDAEPVRRADGRLAGWFVVQTC